MPHPSEQARIEAENEAPDRTTTIEALRELIRQEDRDAYAVKLRAASARRRELNG